jgi:hypothetical protein
MAKNKSSISIPFFDVFKYALVGTFGAISAYILVALYSLFFVGIGLYLINRFNKKNTEHFKELQFGQYVGIVFIILGLLPYVQYFFISLMVEGGEYVGEYALNQMINN